MRRIVSEEDITHVIEMKIAVAKRRWPYTVHSGMKHSGVKTRRCRQLVEMVTTNRMWKPAERSPRQIQDCMDVKE